ncbi:protein BatD [bacterium]|nr:protein BatD [bacterium]
MIACVCRCAEAQNTGVTASVHKNRVSLDESIILTVTCENIQPDGKPQIPPISGMDVVFQGQSKRGSSQVSIIVNGRQQTVKNVQSYIYQYELIPTQPGQGSIPSITVLAGGKKYYTEPIQFTVTKSVPEEERDVFITVALSTTDCFVEQPVVMEIKWYFTRSIESYALDIPFLPALKNFILKDIAPVNNKDYEKIVYNQQVMEYFENTAELRNGIKTQVLVLRKIFVPISSGTYTFEPILLRCDVVKGYKDSQEQFGFGLFSSRRPVIEHRTVRSQPITLTVNSLPPVPAGYPSVVSVGSYRMDVSAEPRTVNVGDPITVMVSIAGDGNIEGIEVPEITTENQFRVFAEDPKTDVSVTAQGIRGTKQFQILLIPLNESITAIPPVTLGYFDPESRSFQKQVSSPIGITVLPAQQSAQPVILSASENAEGKKEVKILHHDLPGYIKFEHKPFNDTHRYVYQRWWYYMFFIVPFLLNCILAVGVKRHKKISGDVQYRRKIRAYRNAQKGLREIKKISRADQGALYSALAHVLSDYIGDKFNIPSGGLTGSVVKDKLAGMGVDAELLERVSAFYQRADKARFMPSFESGTAAVSDSKEVRQIIRKIEKFKW